MLYRIATASKETAITLTDSSIVPAALDVTDPA
jgi:hypothetical protein